MKDPDIKDLGIKDRLILSNQFRILAEVDPDNADSYEEKAEIVENGFTLAYEWLAPHIIESPVSEGICREVMDILGMYRSLNSCASEAGQASVRFPGFDGNNEGDHFAFAQFLVFRQGKWRELLDAKDDINSHREMLPRYRNMLTKWRQHSDEGTLDWDAARKILGD